MNIRQKSFLVIASSLTISAALNFGVLRLAVFPSFVELEHQRAIDDVSRVAAAIKSQVSEIDKTTVAYATWDDSYTHVLDSNVEFIRANYYKTAMDNFDVNFVAIINRDRQPLYEAAYFKDQETILPAGKLATAVIDPEGLLSVTSDDANLAGLLMTARGPLLVVARPILHSIRDLYGRPALLVDAKVDRGVSEAGMSALRVAMMGGIIVAGLIVIAVMIALLQAVLVGPTSKLTQHLLAIGSSGDLSRRVALSRRDEIGVLSQEFDAMLRKLSDARNRLLEQSYSAGIAEMAAGVLHNIRNQLAPLSLRLNRLQHTLGQVTDSKLGRAVEELKSTAISAERKQKILQYVELTLNKTNNRQHNIVDELTGIADGFVRIEHVLRDLDRFSRKEGTISEVNMIDLVRDTVGVLPKFPDIEVTIRIDPDMEHCPAAASDPFILRHVLQNLLVNAIESMMAANKTRGTIRIRADGKEEAATRVIHLQVQDEGVGIAPDKLKTIFACGFSSKKGERRGTGLHWCANSMLAIGGRIFAESPGPGSATTMHLIIPVPQPALKAVA